MISGLGGNIVVMGGEDGALVIDCGRPDMTEKMLAEVGKSGAVALVVNTHWHFDHVGGNEALARAGARILAHDNCHRRMSTEQYVEAVDVRTPPSPAAALPRITFNRETNLHTNGDLVRLVPVAPAHTDGDVVVVFQNADVIHAGDLFFNGMYPFIDYSSGGWIGGNVEAIRTIAAMAGAKTRIVPGHGTLGTADDLKRYLAMLETVQERLEKLNAEGKTVEEVLAAAPTKDLDDTWGNGYLKPEKFVRFAYNSLLKRD
jgi:glyoxylase-like metal-dependent hydrolase (beta-lactamase superfamily II)